MPGKELRDDLSKEEIEERTIKTGVRSSKGGERNKVKAIRKKKKVKRTAVQRAARGVGRDWSVMRTVRLTALIRDFTESCKDCETDFKLPTVGLFFHLQQRTSVS